MNGEQEKKVLEILENLSAAVGSVNDSITNLIAVLKILDARIERLEQQS